MNNELIFKSMIDTYNRLAFTHNYIFGFETDKNIVAIKTTSKVLPYVLCLDKTSSHRGGEYSLRFSPNKSQKELLKLEGGEVICSKEYFDSLVSSSKYNKGEIFEQLVTEKVGQTWVKDTVPFTKDGDVTIEGIPYQIKFTKATFATESSLRHLSQ